MKPAKFVMLVNKDKKYNDDILKEGLIDIYTYFSLGYANNPYTFTDTEHIKYHLKNDNKFAYWIYDVEVPHFEQFISFEGEYEANRIILSNPRIIYKDDESYDFYTKTEIISDDMYNPELLPLLKNSNKIVYRNYASTYIAKKDNNHLRLWTEVLN